MPFKISNNVPLLLTLCMHGVDYFKVVQRARSKFCLESFFFSSKKPVFHTFHWA